jgi:ubiquinone biosynthesis monooxygenase Coq7
MKRVSHPLYLLPSVDQTLRVADTALRAIFTRPHASRTCPTVPELPTDLTAPEKRQAAALMRVNHVGEVCAQALYTAQALATDNAELRQHLQHAAQEETDHLAWTRQRLDELGGRTSVLNPLWYAGAFSLGLIAGKLGGDRLSLGFVVETERQVEAHLESHLERLPVRDHASRAIVAQMKDDEARHGAQAKDAGGVELPKPVKALMRVAAKLMTTTAHYV